MLWLCWFLNYRFLWYSRLHFLCWRCLNWKLRRILSDSHYVGICFNLNILWRSIRCLVFRHIGTYTQVYVHIGIGWWIFIVAFMFVIHSHRNSIFIVIDCIGLLRIYFIALRWSLCRMIHRRRQRSYICVFRVTLVAVSESID